MTIKIPPAPKRMATEKQQEFLVKHCGYTEKEAAKTSFEKAGKVISETQADWENENQIRRENRLFWHGVGEHRGYDDDDLD